jgi:hypothetical protein
MSGKIALARTPQGRHRAAAFKKGFVAMALLLAICLPSAAHNGPPFPIITDQRVGPCVISLWTHPDLGTGTFWIMVDPLPGATVPKDLKIQVGVQPVSKRLAEVVYKSWPEKARGQVQFKSEAQFDQDEMWQVRLILESSAGNGQTTAQVEATPAGFGRWDLLLYALPFLAVGFLWFRAIARRWGYRNRAEIKNGGDAVPPGAQG